MHIYHRTHHRSLLSTVACGLLVAALFVSQVNAFGCFFDYKLCQRDPDGAHKCDAYFGHNWIQNHHTNDIKGCENYNQAHCHADGGPQKCSQGPGVKAPTFDPSAPITGPSKAWADEQDFKKYAALIGNVGGIVAGLGAVDAPVVSAVSYMISPLVNFFTSTYGGSQCKHGQTANADGTCTDWTKVWHRITNYVHDYVHYTSEITSADTVHADLVYVYGQMSDIRNYIQTDQRLHQSQIDDSYLLQKIRNLDEKMERMRPHFKFLWDKTEMSDTDFVRQLQLLRNENPVANWGMVTAMPHFYSMHLSVKIMAMWSSPVHAKNVAGHIINRAHTYNNNVISLFNRLQKVRLAAFTQTVGTGPAPVYTASKHNGKCFETDEYKVVSCDKDPTDRGDVEARPTTFQTVKDTWPTCQWSKTSVVEYYAWDSDHSCMGYAHCDRSSSSKPDSTAMGCLSEHKEWAMANWRAFWTRELLNAGTWGLRIAKQVQHHVISPPAPTPAPTAAPTQSLGDLAADRVAQVTGTTPAEVKNKVNGFLRGLHR